MDRLLKRFSDILQCLGRPVNGLLFVFLYSAPAFAVSTLSYHGRIVNPDGSAFEPNSATLKVQIRSTGAEDCLMYEETYSNVDMSGTNGIFSVNLGSGVGTRTDGSGLTFSQVFTNYPTALTVPLANCTGGSNSITITSSAHRVIRMLFKSSAMPSFEDTPDLALSYVPFSMDSQKVGGYSPANLLRVEDGTGPQSVSALTPANFTELLALINGTSAQYAPPAGGTASAVSAGAGTAASPSISFSGDTNTGFYSSGADQIGVSAGGAQIFNYSSNSFSSVTTGGGSVTSVNGTAAAPTFSFTGDTDTGWFRPAADTLAAATGGTERVRIDSTGYVGIGTSSPIVPLHISSDGTGSRAIIDSYNATPSPTLTFRAARGTAASPTAVQTGDALFTIGGRGHTGTAFSNTPKAAISGYAAEGWGASSGAYLAFSTTPIGSNITQESLRITDSGSVGIGTTSPAGTLHLSDGNAVNSALLTTDKIVMSYQDVSAGMSFVTASNIAAARGVFKGARARGTLDTPTVPNNNDDVLSFLGAIYDGSTTQATAMVDFRVDGAVSAGVAPQRIGFWTSETTGAARTEKMSIKSNGNVGIGTTAPGTKLDVVGAITSRPYGTNTGETGQIILHELAAGGTHTATIRAPDAIAASYVLTLPGDDGASGEVLTTDGNGNLSWGAGGGGTASSVAASAGTAAAPSISFSGDTNTGLYSVGADQLGVAVNGANIFTLDATGLTAATTGGGLVKTGNGDATAPTFSFAGDTDTGWFRPAADTMAAATAGTERVRIDSSGKVGVGTNSPLFLMDVVTPASSTNLRFARNGTVGGGYLISTSDSQFIVSGGSYWDGTNWVAKHAGPTNITGSFGQIKFSADSGQTVDGTFTPTERMRIHHNGYVGIGTANPLTFLHLYSNQPRLRIQDDNNASSYFEIYDAQDTQTLIQKVVASGTTLIDIQPVPSDGTSDSYIRLFRGTNTTGIKALQLYKGDNTAVAHAQIGVDGQDSYFQIGGGDVGIGTTSPAAKLDVNGGVRALEAMELQRAGNHASNDTPVFVFRRGRDTMAAPSAVVSGDSLGSFEWGAYNGSAWTDGWNGGADMTVRATENWTTTNNGTSLSFRTTPNGSNGVVDRFFIDQNGYVGIGTTIPVTTMDVVGAITSRPYGTATGEAGQIILRELAAGGTNTATIRAPDALGANYVLTLPADDGASGEVLTTNGSGVLSWVAAGAATTIAAGAGTAAAPSISFSGDPDTGWFNPSADAIAVSTAGSERMRIANNGNVGIGTTSTTALLTMAQGSDLQFVNTNGHLAGFLVNGGNFESAYAEHFVANWAGGERARLSSNIDSLSHGGVSSQSDLQVYGKDGVTVATTASGATRGFRVVTAATQDSLGYTGGTGTEALTVLGSGLTGIGTTTPRATLDVNGTITGKPAISNAGTTIDFSTGNLQYTAANCQAYILHNMKDGGSYVFSVKGATSATCSFTAFSDAGTTALTVHMPPGHGATTVSKHTLYNYLVLGTDVYVSWIPGY